jgi:cob(I)alamin adenosyltransferase
MCDAKGLIHLYIGNGKGKTTAALGLAARALGWKYEVFICQFLKSTPSGECAFFSNQPLVSFYRPAMRHASFIWHQSPQELEETREDLMAGWQHARRSVLSGRYHLAILDEVLDAVICGFIPESELIELICAKPAQTEIVLTGRDASPEIRELSDYLSIIDSKKHPFDKGNTARKGIEY